MVKKFPYVIYDEYSEKCIKSCLVEGKSLLKKKYRERYSIEYISKNTDNEKTIYVIKFVRDLYKVPMDELDEFYDKK